MHIRSRRLDLDRIIREPHLDRGTEDRSRFQRFIHIILREENILAMLTHHGTAQTDHLRIGYVLINTSVRGWHCRQTGSFQRDSDIPFLDRLRHHVILRPAGDVKTPFPSPVIFKELKDRLKLITIGQVNKTEGSAFFRIKRFRFRTTAVQSFILQIVQNTLSRCLDPVGRISEIIKILADRV